MKRILFLFLDGVGIGPAGPTNPLSQYDGSAFRRLANGQPWCRPFAPHSSPTHVVRSLDAALGVEGLPQSGTGQASLLTGVNCAAVVGRHFGPFPHSETHPTLDDRNVFRQVRERLPAPDVPVAFANAFPPQYFNASRRRATVTTYCCNAAAVRLRTLSDLREGQALSADLTGTTWREQLHLDVDERSPAQAAGTLGAITRENAFTLFEYFLTDKVGHRRIEMTPSRLLDAINTLLSGLLEDLNPARDTLLLTSDHGNLEDTSHKQHTRNPVPLIVYGWAAPFFENATDLTDVTPGIVEALRTSTTP